MKIPTAIHAGSVKGAGRLASLVILVLSILPAGMTQAADDYQLNALLAPSEALLRAEANGMVMIYDGLAVDTVDRALDQQFSRIDNMMFVRTQYPVEGGDYEAEEDGCD